MTYHSNYSLDVLEHAAKNGVGLLEIDGKPIPKERALELIRAQRERGYKWWPVCANVDEVGKCQGHEEA